MQSCDIIYWWQMSRRKMLTKSNILRYSRASNRHMLQRPEAKDHVGSRKYTSNTELLFNASYYFDTRLERREWSFTRAWTDHDKNSYPLAQRWSDLSPQAPSTTLDQASPPARDKCHPLPRPTRRVQTTLTSYRRLLSHNMLDGNEPGCGVLVRFRLGWIRPVWIGLDWIGLD